MVTDARSKNIWETWHTRMLLNVFQNIAVKIHRGLAHAQGVAAHTSYKHSLYWHGDQCSAPHVAASIRMFLRASAKVTVGVLQF